MELSPLSETPLYHEGTSWHAPTYLDCTFLVRTMPLPLIYTVKAVPSCSSVVAPSLFGSPIQGKSYQQTHQSRLSLLTRLHIEPSQLSSPNYTLHIRKVYSPMSDLGFADLRGYGNVVHIPIPMTMPRLTSICHCRNSDGA